MNKRISQAELDVMDVLWDGVDNGQAVMLATDIATGLAHKNWNLHTVKTLLGRLRDKGVITFEKDGRRYLYSPRISRSDYAKRATSRLADRLFGGRVSPMVAHMADARGLSKDDIAELEALIAKSKQDGAGA